MNDTDFEQSPASEPLDPPLRARLVQAGQWLGIAVAGVLVTRRYGYPESALEGFFLSYGCVTFMGGVAMAIFSIVPECLNLTNEDNE